MVNLAHTCFLNGFERKTRSFAVKFIRKQMTRENDDDERTMVIVEYRGRLYETNFVVDYWTRNHYY